MFPVFKPAKFLLMACATGIPVFAEAQFSLDAQLCTRTEWRNGTGTLRSYGAEPSFFTSQRMRLIAQYQQSRLQFKLSLQDVRVWGQDASGITVADGARLGVHEAWAELVLANNNDSAFKHSMIDRFSIRIGRQELLYDDARLLGNLDWLQQGRRHDALVLKLKEKKFSVDAGFAFSQNTDAFGYNGTYYTPANVQPSVRDSKGNLVLTPSGMIPLVNAGNISVRNGSPALVNPAGTNGQTMQYKAMQFVHGTYKNNHSVLSAMFLADHFGKHQFDSVQNISGTDTGYIYGKRFKTKGVYSRITAGLQLSGAFDKQGSWQYKAGAYYQAGKDREGVSLAAYMLYASLSHQQGSLSYYVGYDLLSGNDAFGGNTKNYRFDPLYGTPHKFWGYMDYFYVGTGSPAGGLSNPQAGIRYAAKKISVALDYHAFLLANDQAGKGGAKLDPYLGSELDLSSVYQLSNAVNLEGGVSMLRATRSMEYAKNISPGTASLNASWAWLMVNIRPNLLKR